MGTFPDWHLPPAGALPGLHFSEAVLPLWHLPPVAAPPALHSWAGVPPVVQKEVTPLPGVQAGVWA